MKAFLNGTEMIYAEHGYQYVFMKPYRHFEEDTYTRSDGNKMHIEFYDNGVQIRTLIAPDEVSTLVNRDVAVDTFNHKIYILEEGDRFRKNPDGSVEILK